MHTGDMNNPRSEMASESGRLKVLSTNGGICRETTNVLPTCFKKHIAIYTQPWHSEEKFKFDADSR